MINWLAQGLLDSAGFVASRFITRDAPQFVVMQGAVAIVLLVSIVAVLAFWPAGLAATQGKEKVVSFWVQIAPVVVVCAIVFALAAKYL